MKFVGGEIGRVEEMGGEFQISGSQISNRGWEGMGEGISASRWTLLFHGGFAVLFLRLLHRDLKQRRFVVAAQ
jgi:hypothetical protein